MNVLISIAAGIIIFILTIAIFRFVAGQNMRRSDIINTAGVLGIILGVMTIFIMFITLRKPLNIASMDADAYARLVAAETSEPKEIVEYRKQLYRELGAEIIQQKKQIRAEAEENAKKRLAKYREQQMKAKLEAEIAKSRDLRLADINEILKESNERGRKSKAVLGEIILLDNEPVEVKARGKTMTFEKYGIYRF